MIKSAIDERFPGIVIVRNELLRDLIRGTPDRQHGTYTTSEQASLAILLPEICAELLARRQADFDGQRSETEFTDFARERLGQRWHICPRTKSVPDRNTNCVSQSSFDHVQRQFIRGGGDPRYVSPKIAAEFETHSPEAA